MSETPADPGQQTYLGLRLALCYDDDLRIWALHVLHLDVADWECILRRLFVSGIDMAAYTD